MRKIGLNEFILSRLYVDLGKTDAEIAEFFNIDRTTVVKTRNSLGIKSRKSTGEIGEELVLKELRSRGYKVEDMNEKDKLHPYDILLDNEIKIEVKSSKMTDNKRFNFCLCEKPSNQNIESESRIRLQSGRTKKLFRKTCDIMIFVGIEPEGDCHFFLIKPEEIPDKTSNINIALNPYSNGKYSKFRENWDLLENIKKSEAPTSDHTV